MESYQRNVNTIFAVALVAFVAVSMLVIYGWSMPTELILGLIMLLVVATGLALAAR
ncbi:hypothetical protein [Bradyrhizobium elkanii]|uniref:hypothetical protein n=1 Tax=Bradyrhizobium elkanii TaxID=29448 RepID=UPI00272B4A5C|nr:hypothetical protein [Bradyrhizobium elkanii]WLA80317.1 hypothetical protein QNJ99_33770 [Bradyrhizobium elkanii]